MPESDEMQHQDTIQSLADECQAPVEEVSRIFYEELQRLEGVARLKVFLPLLVRHRVQLRLRGKEAGEPTGS
ncbi:DUF3562 domain-containing protein [Acidithiobacillus ferrianus]|uniref:DUF3562 domain-containing protein n=1 Tax=Acidithiobacillus ferrianus TaxID=2678518 RepID=UPI0034E3CA88